MRGRTVPRGTGARTEWLKGSGTDEGDGGGGKDADSVNRALLVSGGSLLCLSTVRPNSGQEDPLPPPHAQSRVAAHSPDLPKALRQPDSEAHRVAVAPPLNP